MRVATTFSVTVLAAAGIGHALVSGIDSGIHRIDPFHDMKNRPAAGHGMNLLVVGVDDRDKITPREKRKYRLGGAPCHCTDTLMIVHISAAHDRASVVSLPRDSFAQLPAHTDRTTGRKHHTHPAKINAAYAEGGPRLTVRTVEKMTNVKIDHYLEVDFTSFMKTVDVLGGVKVCTERRLKDSYTGLDLSPGTHLLSGGQALQYVRSRHADGSSDLGRMRRQQKFLASLIAKTTSSGVLLNPVKFREVASTLLKSVRADRGFGTDQLVDLARAMRNFSPSSSEFATVPISDLSFPVKGIGSTVKWDDKKAAKLFQALRDDKPLAVHRAHRRTTPVEVAPKQIRVQVENATKTAGLGRKADAALRTTGFRTTGLPRNATASAAAAAGRPAHTTVLYDPRWDRSAKSLAAALPGARLKAVKGQGATMTVLVGTDYKGVRAVRAKEANQGEFGTVTGDQVTCG
ncbi:LCP family protein [Streptomyces sp. GXMU-J5]|uniref:LCP family protein n=1 Tax=Streptomyces beihaiensis TaxID=2984495 RepID=A0ABT3U240_9ACTN|nr:LCP family protein [Streptomyces beihaiensis]MCX3063378.1 LCP family protein [Streptomyces beihaiensis]